MILAPHMRARLLRQNLLRGHQLKRGADYEPVAEESTTGNIDDETLLHEELRRGRGKLQEPRGERRTPPEAGEPSGTQGSTACILESSPTTPQQNESQQPRSLRGGRRRI